MTRRGRFECPEQAPTGPCIRMIHHQGKHHGRCLDRRGDVTCTLRADHEGSSQHVGADGTRWGGVTVVCRWCGTEEPNDWLLRNNHDPDCGMAVRDGLCVAMHLTRNHVAYDLANDPDRVPHSIARARTVWPLLRWGWIEDAQAELDRLIARTAPPAHTTPVDMEQGALL